jgi:hypothetical protein
VIPVEEYKHLYTTRYEINEETLALLLMKSERRVIRKNGVQCFQNHWFYLDEAMSEFKGRSVEIRYSDDDYTKVFVVLPNMKMCEAKRIDPTSLLNPNKETLKRIKSVRTHEQKLTNGFELLTHSILRGETVEDRVARELEEIQKSNDANSHEEAQSPQGQVHQLTRLDHTRRNRASRGTTVTVEMVSRSPADISIFAEEPENHIREFDYDE